MPIAKTHLMPAAATRFLQFLSTRTLVQLSETHANIFKIIYFANGKIYMVFSLSEEQQ